MDTEQEDACIRKLASAHAPLSARSLGTNGAMLEA
jgi:hypothetical protein